MFGQSKNKDNDPSGSQGMAPGGSRSLFASELNIAAAPVRFGFERQAAGAPASVADPLPVTTPDEEDYLPETLPYLPDDFSPTEAAEPRWQEDMNAAGYGDLLQETAVQFPQEAAPEDDLEALFSPTAEPLPPHLKMAPTVSEPTVPDVPLSQTVTPYEVEDALHEENGEEDWGLTGAQPISHLPPMASPVAELELMPPPAEDFPAALSPAPVQPVLQPDPVRESAPAEPVSDPFAVDAAGAWEEDFSAGDAGDAFGALLETGAHSDGLSDFLNAPGADDTFATAAFSAADEGVYSLRDDFGVEDDDTFAPTGGAAAGPFQTNAQTSAVGEGGGAFLDGVESAYYPDDFSLLNEDVLAETETALDEAATLLLPDNEAFGFEETTPEISSPGLSVEMAGLLPAPEEVIPEVMPPPPAPLENDADDFDFYEPLEPDDSLLIDVTNQSEDDVPRAPGFDDLGWGTPDPAVDPFTPTGAAADIPNALSELSEAPAARPASQPAVPPPMPQPSAAGFAGLSADLCADPEQLRVLNVCELSHDKRLLLVETATDAAGPPRFALMAQSGAMSNPEIAVLKIFDQSPLMPSGTEFSAMREGTAGDKDMYITRVGSWQGIISSDEDAVILHAELSR
ncbi:MAG: hypothetical protein AB7P76_00115 [Candidatus Melainabacteria bacterium]